MTCEIYMVGLPIMPIKASIFRPSLVYECLSVLGECWDNGLSRVCCMDGWHLHLHIGDCINRPRQSGETHNNNSSHFLVNLQHITAQNSFHIGRKCEQGEESRIKSEPSIGQNVWDLQTNLREDLSFTIMEKASSWCLQCKCVSRCFQLGEGPSRGLLHDWL